MPSSIHFNSIQNLSFISTLFRFGFLYTEDATQFTSRVFFSTQNLRKWILNLKFLFYVSESHGTALVVEAVQLVSILIRDPRLYGHFRNAALYLSCSDVAQNLHRSTGEQKPRQWPDPRSTINVLAIYIKHFNLRQLKFTRCYVMLSCIIYTWMLTVSWSHWLMIGSRYVIVRLAPK